MRNWSALGSLLIGIIFALPVAGYAQDSVMTGTVIDSTGGVLPGVTVTATNVDSGNTFVAVSDDRGNFRLPVRIGNYRLTIELTGFATVNRSIQMLVGQTSVLNFQMSPSNLQETVTVTGEPPLVDTTTSTVGSNIDPRQMSELPLNGRNWMDLSLHQHRRCHVRRLLPQRQVQLSRLHHAARAAVLQSAAQWNARRADRQGSDPLLRQLRIRAGTEYVHLQQPIPLVQHRPALHESHTHHAGPLGLSVHAGHAAHGARLGLPHAVLQRRGQQRDDASIRWRDARPDRAAVLRDPLARRQHEDDERDSRRDDRLRAAGPAHRAVEGWRLPVPSSPPRVVDCHHVARLHHRRRQPEYLSGHAVASR